MDCNNTAVVVIVGHIYVGGLVGLHERISSKSGLGQDAELPSFLGGSLTAAVPLKIARGMTFSLDTPNIGKKVVLGTDAYTASTTHELVRHVLYNQRCCVDEHRNLTEFSEK